MRMFAGWDPVLLPSRGRAAAVSELDQAAELEVTGARRWSCAPGLAMPALILAYRHQPTATEVCASTADPRSRQLRRSSAAGWALTGIPSRIANRAACPGSRLGTGGQLSW
jgi:hypothetical protein